MTQAVVDYSDGIKLTDGSTDVTFRLLGGKYAVLASATWGGGSVDVTALMPDGSTYVSVLSSVFTVNGAKIVDLPPGSYKIDITTATAVYVAVAPIPIRSTV